MFRTLTWLIDLVGATGAVLTTLCWLPQALKVIREKETHALSLPATVAFSGWFMDLQSATGR
jgi:MtN3 and saliva related transmembrane protein